MKGEFIVMMALTTIWGTEEHYITMDIENGIRRFKSKPIKDGIAHVFTSPQESDAAVMHFASEYQWRVVFYRMSV